MVHKSKYLMLRAVLPLCGFCVRSSFRPALAPSHGWTSPAVQGVKHSPMVQPMVVHLRTSSSSQRTVQGDNLLQRHTLGLNSFNIIKARISTSAPAQINTCQTDWEITAAVNEFNPHLEKAHRDVEDLYLFVS